MTMLCVFRNTHRRRVGASAMAAADTHAAARPPIAPVRGAPRARDAAPSGAAAISAR